MKTEGEVVRDFLLAQDSAMEFDIEVTMDDGEFCLRNGSHIIRSTTLDPIFTYLSGFEDGLSEHHSNNSEEMKRVREERDRYKDYAHCLWQILDDIAMYPSQSDRGAYVTKRCEERKRYFAYDEGVLKETEDEEECPF
jgi:hypothetical protein